MRDLRIQIAEDTMKIVAHGGYTNNEDKFIPIASAKNRSRVHKFSTRDLDFSASKPSVDDFPQIIVENEDCLNVALRLTEIYGVGEPPLVLSFIDYNSYAI